MSYEEILYDVGDGIATITLNRPGDAAVREADTEMIASFGTHDFGEGVGAFVGRRPPRFTGE